MSTSAAYKGNDGKIYFYQGTSDSGSFEREWKKSDKLTDFNSNIRPKNITFIHPFKGQPKGLDTKYPIYSRDSLLKAYPEYVKLTEGYKSSQFTPSLKAWEAEDFKGKKYLLYYKNKRLIKRPLRRVPRRRRDGIIQRYWRR